MRISSSQSGIEIRSNNTLIFFGSQRCTLESLAEKYPRLNFFHLKQVHGVEGQEVTEIPDSLESKASRIHQVLDAGDMLFSKLPNVALVIKTADCMPLLGFSKATGEIKAIHAGWRGLVCGIVQKWASDSDFQWFLGPHLTGQSFCVRKDTWAQFVDAFGATRMSRISICPKALDGQSDQTWISMADLVRDSMESPFRLFELRIDTKLSASSDLAFYSHRQNPTSTLRNLSFITRLV